MRGGTAYEGARRGRERRRRLVEPVASWTTAGATVSAGFGVRRVGLPRRGRRGRRAANERVRVRSAVGAAACQRERGDGGGDGAGGGRAKWGREASVCWRAWKISDSSMHGTGNRCDCARRCRDRSERATGVHPLHALLPGRPERQLRSSSNGHGPRTKFSARLVARCRFVPTTAPKAWPIFSSMPPSTVPHRHHAASGPRQEQAP